MSILLFRPILTNSMSYLAQGGKSFYKKPKSKVGMYVLVCPSLFAVSILFRGQAPVSFAEVAFQRFSFFLHGLSEIKFIMLYMTFSRLLSIAL